MFNVNLMLFAISTAFLIIACGNDSDSSSNAVNTIVIKNKTISGVSQKGPFVIGSSVTVQELDGETLAQTGGSFEGKIKNDLGEFSVKVKQLESQYALLKANGFYRNEVTGEKSKSQVTLYALTDLSNRDEVNVNLLTHLAYERTLYLVMEEGLSVADAKKQAEADVLKSFGIEGDFDAAEDLNIFGESDQNAALLAISILMQGNLSEGDFSERLATYAADIETDGIWNDSKTVTKIADWANAQWLGSGLTKIREKITKWDLSADLPMFEKYVNNYWWQKYDLGTCESKREGEVLKNQNAASVKANEYYICKSGAWHVAKDIEKDTYNWLDSNTIRTEKDGDIRYGDEIKTNCYVFEDKIWRSGNASDCSLGLRGCTSLRQDTIVKGSDNVWYICDEKKWRIATDIEIDPATRNAGKFDGEIRAGQINKAIYYIYETDEKAWRVATKPEMDTYDYENNKPWSSGDDGELKKGSVTETIYVFDYSTWRAADSAEKKLGGCIAAKADSIEMVDNVYYICTSRKWVAATALQYDTYKKSCTEFGQITHGNVNEKYAYFCYGETWKRFYGNENISYGKLVDERDGQIYRTVKIGKQIWMAENLNYADSINYPSMLGRNWCKDDDPSNCETYGRFYSWSASIDSIYWNKQGYECGFYDYYNKYDESSFIENCSLPPKIQGICPDGWRLTTKEDWNDLYTLIGENVKALQAKGFEKWSSATDKYGFSILPTGLHLESYFAFSNDSPYAFFWTSTDHGKNGAEYCIVENTWIATSSKESLDKVNGLSVRCVKDEE